MSHVNVFCLPFAGGGKHSYQEYTRYAPRDVNLIPIELPGRGSRYAETPLTCMNDMVRDVLGQIRDDLSTPYAIYGHSMGTILAYLTVKEIIRSNLPVPVHLFLTGCAGPSVRHTETPRYQLSKAAFVDSLKSMGGIPEPILQDDSVIDFFEPVLRADFQAVETYEFRKSDPFHIPITVCIGRGEKTTYAEAMAWQLETTEEIYVKQFPGQHFFIFEYSREMMILIHRTLFRTT